MNISTESFELFPRLMGNVVLK